MKALAILVAIGGVAYADDPKPDPNAQAKAEEANLISIAPRQGLAEAVALGPGLILTKGTDDTIPLGGSFRLGHVATPQTLVVLELAVGGNLHQIGTTRLVDSTTTGLVGGQLYVAPSLWVRMGGGWNVHTIDNGPMGTSVHLGLAGDFGVGVDLVRAHFWRLGLESYGILVRNSEGWMWIGNLALGLAHY